MSNNHKSKTDNKGGGGKRVETTDRPSNTDAKVVNELKSLYLKKLLPIEKKNFFHDFHKPEILPTELGAKPTILLLGQYRLSTAPFEILLLILYTYDLASAKQVS